MTKTMFDHADALYSYLVQHSVDGVYSGTKTEAWRVVGTSQTYYSPMWAALEELGCIETLYLGGRGRRVALRLVEPPDPEKFSEIWRMRNLTSGKSYATLQRDVEAILKKLPAIDIGSALANHAARLERIEKALDIRQER